MVPRARTDGGIVSVSLNTNSFLCSFLCVRASLASKMDYKEKSTTTRKSGSKHDLVQSKARKG